MANNIQQKIELSQIPLQASSSGFTASQKLRIYLEYTNAFNALTDAQYYKDYVITPAVNYLQTALSPKNPASSPILVDRDCQTDFVYVNNDPTKKACTTDCNPTTLCSNITVPDKYLKKCYKQSGNSFVYVGTDGVGGPDADIIIIVTSLVCSGTMLASALSCFQEPTLDRPVLGALILCQQQWNPRYNIQMNINTIKHEIIHALGFAFEKFAFYRDQNGKPLTTRDAVGQPNGGYSTVGGFLIFSDKVAKLVTRNRKSLKVLAGYTIQKYSLTLPTLLSQAQTFFNCPTLDGVDLEDSAPAGTINSHFDKLFVNNELMSPTSDVGEGRTSIFTLALLQDTGWYNVDFTMAENYTYGKGLGCDFLLNGCYDYIQKQTTNQLSISPFCNVIPIGYAMQCSDNRLFTYSCQISKSVGLDPKYVYFNQLPNIPSGEDAQTYAGESLYNEYCPVNMKVAYGIYTSDCTVSNNALRTDTDFVQWNDYYGSDSKCFDTTATAWNINTPTMSYTPVYYGAKCFKYKCDATTLTLYVYNNDQTVCQTTTNSVINQIKINYLTAYINCPTYASICIVVTTTTSSGINYTTQNSKSKAYRLTNYTSWIIISILASNVRF